MQIKDYEKALQLLEWGKGRILRKKLNSDNLDIFQDKNHIQMNKEKLGVNQHYQLPVVQDELNPNLKNYVSFLGNIFTKKYIFIDGDK